MSAPSGSLLREKSALLLSVVVFLLSVTHQLHGESARSPAPTNVDSEVLVTDGAGNRGGRLVTALGAEPKTLNPLYAIDTGSKTILGRLHADLIHIDRDSQQTGLALAKSMEVSDDGLVYTLRLRQGIRFSDGHPFDADDVVFSFRVYLDEELASLQRDLLVVGGRALEVKKIDSMTVEFRLAEPYAVIDRLFDSVFILPEHVLGAAYEAGKLKDVWSIASREKNVVGLGPFRLKEYLPGKHCLLERNPHYWKVDEKGTGLPYLDQLLFLFLGSEEAQLAHFQSGQIDVIDQLSGEDFLGLEAQSKRQAFRLYDLGASLRYDFLVFNLNDLSGKSLPDIEKKQEWFRRVEFRQAISAAIDRAALVRLAYRGRATPLWSHVSSGNKRWVNEVIPKPKRSVSRARKLLEAASFSWDEKQRLVDASGTVVELSIMTSSSNRARLSMATIIQEDLKDLGIAVEVVPIEYGALVERLTRRFTYDVAIMAIVDGDADPNPQLPLLLSNGSLHLWHLNQEQPATAWEREIDHLMRQQVSMRNYDERKKAFDKVLELMAAQVPIISLASPNVLVGAKTKLGNFRPAILKHSILWNAEELYWQR